MCFAGHERPPPLTHSLLTATLEGMMAEAWSASGLGAQSLSRTGSIRAFREGHTLFGRVRSSTVRLSSTLECVPELLNLLWGQLLAPAHNAQQMLLRELVEALGDLGPDRT